MSPTDNVSASIIPNSSGNVNADISEREQVIYDEMDTDAEQRLGEHGKEVYNELKREDADKIDYYGGFMAYYTAGKDRKDINVLTSEYGKSMSADQKQMAYYAGYADSFTAKDNKVANTDNTVYNNNSDISYEGAKQNEKESLRLRDGGKRYVGADTSGQIFRVEEGTRRIEERNTNSRPADKRATSLAHGRTVSSSSIGLSNGTDTENVFVVEKKKYTPSMKKAERKARARGLEATFFVGNNIEFVNSKGKVKNARAYIEENRVFVRADHSEYTADQLIDHELGDRKIWRKQSERYSEFWKRRRKREK